MPAEGLAEATVHPCGPPLGPHLGCVPLIVLREPAKCLLMFPFAFGCRSGSVFSFPGWCHRHPPFLLAHLFAAVELCSRTS